MPLLLCYRKILILNYYHYASVWAEPRRHTVVCLFVSECVCVCVCVRIANLSNRAQLSAETCNTGRSRQFMKTKFGRFSIKGFVFELWRDLHTQTAVASALTLFVDKTVYSVTRRLDL